MRNLLLASLLGLSAACSAPQAPAPADAAARARFDEAIALVHAYNHTGDELDRAFAIGEELLVAAPGSGYSETIRAEVICTFRVDDAGEPAQMRSTAMSLAYRAQGLDRRFAEANSALARCHMRGGEFEEAIRAAEDALAIDQNEPNALNVLAHTRRRMGKGTAEVEPLFVRYVDAVDDPARQAKAYAWIGVMHEQEAVPGAADERAHVDKARAAYERAVTLDPGAVHVLSGYAEFLADIGELDAAERRGLEAMNLGGTRKALFAIAGARYQRLAGDPALQGEALAAALAAVEQALSIPLADVAAYCGFSRVKARLEALRPRLAEPMLLASTASCEGAAG